METPCCIVDDYEVVMDASSLNEGTLVRRDQLVHMWCKSQRQNFSDYFGKRMNETDRPKITNGVCTIFLGQQDDVCGVQ
jgi:hypothetical protein